MPESMTSRERIALALQHREPDRVPLDIGSSSSTGISARAYRSMCEVYGVSKDVQISDVVQQLAIIDESVLDALRVDTRGVSPNPMLAAEAVFEEDSEYRYLTDGFGIRYAMPLAEGVNFDMVGPPLAGSVTREEIARYRFPEPGPIPSPLLAAMQAWSQRANPPAVVLEATPGAGGILEMCSWLRGYEDFMLDLAGDPPLAQQLMERVLEYKLACWKEFFASARDDVAVAFESDDLGTQTGPMISPITYHDVIKPLHRQLFDGIRQMSPRPVAIALHSCGSVVKFLPDLIDIGLDILNPVQVSARDMDTKMLKERFGRDLVFWGGGVDTQRILPFGTPQEVRDEVKRRVDDLAPGGGFVFAPVHNIQPFVPVENIRAFFDAFETVRAYR